LANSFPHAEYRTSNASFNIASRKCQSARRLWSRERRFFVAFFGDRSPTDDPQLADTPIRADIAHSDDDPRRVADFGDTVVVRT
jgi:hypothetical protein